MLCLLLLPLFGCKSIEVQALGMWRQEFEYTRKRAPREVPLARLRVRGRLVQPDRSAVGNAEVHLIANDGTQYTATSDSTGRYRMPKVQEGSYTVHVLHEDTTWLVRKNVGLQAKPPRKRVRLNLAQADTSKATARAHRSRVAAFIRKHFTLHH